MPNYINYIQTKGAIIMWRKIEIIVLLVLIAITAVAYIKARKESYKAAKAMDEKLKNEKAEETKIILTATIDGMMCEKCAARVTEALSKYGSVEINLDEKTATITANELPDTEEVKSTITELGYTVLNIE